METRTFAEELEIGGWRARHLSGELAHADGARCRLEPKVMDLLMVLARQPGAVVTRAHLLATLWPGMVVGDDTLARAVSKLRQALGDDARAPQYIETIAKRGYRLLAGVRTLHAPQAQDALPAHPPAPDVPSVPDAPIAAPSAQQMQWPPQPPVTGRRGWTIWRALAGVLLAGSVAWGVWSRTLDPSIAPSAEPSAVVPATALEAASEVATPSPDLLARADDYYFQYTQADNLAAITLYERVMAQRPDHAPALAGLANAWVQQQMRWPQGAALTYRTLGDALAAGHLRTPAARRVLQEARQIAERGVALAPELAATHKALGLVYSAQGEFAAARAAYARALQLDPNAWGVLINLGDLAEIEGDSAAALGWFQRAWTAMAVAYPQESARIRPWHAALGTLIGDRLRNQGLATLARQWYLRVLEQAPDHRPAQEALAQLAAATARPVPKDADAPLSPAGGN